MHRFLIKISSVSIGRLNFLKRKRKYHFGVDVSVGISSSGETAGNVDEQLVAEFDLFRFQLKKIMKLILIIDGLLFTNIIYNLHHTNGVIQRLSDLLVPYYSFCVVIN